MDSKLLMTIHLVAVNLFLLIYLVKTVLLFTGAKRLDKFSRIMKIPEMLVSAVFLLSGIWLYAILGAIKVMQVAKLGMVILSIPLAVTGFKKHKKGLALLAMFLLVCAYGISEASRSKTYLPSKVTLSGGVTAASTEGAELYLSHCAMCHGPAGDKEYRGAAPLSLSRMDTTAAAMVVTEGMIKGPRGTMPSFLGVLNQDQVHAVVGYIQLLKK